MQRVPVSVAARQGVSRLTSDAERERVFLTNHGRVVAVVDSAERLDADLERLREATNTFLDLATARLEQRSQDLTLDEACRRLGVTVESVRRRARELADA